ncbi:unnamed protein product [Diatraea saccharalis]|uniref:AMP-dependent synthetase/ligase domain-containing protein n=1 Tax=Diatraea saccharalis TaxID=40085 RepID=A0A9P0C8E1_9NEOP|nr:unnamed protein product [Diatraea saccharalis]
MSHAILRGCPTEAQLYLDTIIDATRESLKNGNNKKERSQVNLGEIIYYSMKRNLDGIFMINGASGETISNRQILSTALPLALAISSNYEAGTVIMLLMRNHQYMAATYYASIFANVVPLLVDPNSTAYELRHFLNLVSPSAVFCDHDLYDDVKNALNDLMNTQIKTIISDDSERLEEFFKGHITNLDNCLGHRISQATPKTDVLLIPTSGSTGLSKATILTHGGVVAQLPVIWAYHNSFPRPEKLALLLSSAQWMTYTILMTTCPVYGVSLLMTPKKPTTEHVLQIIDTYRPTWGLLGPTFAKSLAASAVPSQLSSIGTIVTAGAPLTENIVTLLKEKLSQSASLRNGIGMTETQSFIAISDNDRQWTTNGKIVNIMLYKASNIML